MKTSLHILSTSFFTSNALDNCLKFISKNDSILLCGDAVNALHKVTKFHQRITLTSKKYKTYTLQDDLESRNINNQYQNIKIINYTKFVQLTTIHNKVISW